MNSPLAVFCLRFLLIIPLWALWSCNNNSHPQTKGESELVLAEQLKSRGSYDSAIIYYRKAVESSLKVQLYSAWAKSISGEIDCLRAKGDLNEALKLAEMAQVFANGKIDTTGNVYNGLIHKKALLLTDKKQFEQASALLTRNIKTYLARSSVLDTGLALSYNGMGTLFLCQDKFDEARIQYQKAIATYEKAGITRSSDYAGSLQNIGIVYSITANYENAEQYFLKALKVSQEILKPNDPKLASLYLNMGRFYQIRRNDSKSMEYLDRAERFYISQNQSNSIVAGLLFLNLATGYIYSVDYEKAQSYLNKSLEIISEKAPGDLKDLLTIYLNMGYIAEKKGDYATAKNYYLKGLSYGDKLPNSMKILRGIASVSFKMSDKPNITKEFYESALQNSIEMYGEDNLETALTYLRFGDYLSVVGNRQALFYLNKSTDLYKKVLGKVNIDVSTAYYYTGNYYYRAKSYEKAIQFFQQSLMAGFPGFTSEKISDNPQIQKDNLNENLINPLTAKATALLLLYQSDTTRIDLLKCSTTCFGLALKMIEMLRSTYQDEDSKLFISENEKNTFSNALLAEVSLYRRTRSAGALEEAFILSEKGKSAVLLSHLRDREAKNIGRIPHDLLALDARLKSEIFFYNKQIHDQKLAHNPDEANIKLCYNHIFDLSRQQDELIKSIEKNYPLYYNLKYDNSVISIEQIRKKLSPKQAMIEYTLTDSTLFIFAITSDKTQLFTSAIDSSFTRNLQTLKQELTGKVFNNYSGSDFREYVCASHELFRTLLLPVQSTIKGRDLIIIPDGELGYLSFDVLLTSLPDTTKPVYRNLPYLIRDCALSYAPSATTFFDELNLHSTQNNGRILAYGPGYGPDNSVLDKKDETGKILRNVLSNLTNSQEEIKILNDYFRVTAFTGKNATETSFKKNASDYRVLHLAMHTIINNENPLYSKLMFFKPKDDTIDDGMLNASELINMELHADMAVLSACNTGSGKMRKGEGIMSLSRDFFYAGVPGIIMTAWAVEDRSGVKLMEYFYKYIAQGKPRNEALRLAKLEYLDKCDKLTAHPHYWASYMNVGDISPLEGFGEKSNSFQIYAVLALLIISALVLLIRLIKKQNSRPA